MMDFKKGPIYMGIINVTPDSFSDGGQFIEVEVAIAHGLQLEREGAHILDIGGESTRPGAGAVSIEEEIGRVIPVIKGLKDAGVQALLSIDTRNAKVMERAIEAGVDIINDVSALTHDADALSVASQSCLPVCLMHMRGDPETMQNDPLYGDVIDEIYTYLATQVERCLQAGMDKNKIICDPGIGFGKTLENNANIFKNIGKFHSLECLLRDAPIIKGHSKE